MRLGVLGGTFDPVHLGHLIIATEAQISLHLDKVIFVPAGQPWLKAKRHITEANHRLAMLQAAVASNPRFTISTQEIERSGPSYAVDTLSSLRQEIGSEDSLYFIAGLDAIAELPKWREPNKLIELCRLVGMKRPGYVELDLKALEREIPGVSDDIILINGTQVDISSSEVRRRVREGISIRYLVPEAVGEYIREKGLYLKG